MSSRSPLGLLLAGALALTGTVAPTAYAAPTPTSSPTPARPAAQPKAAPPTVVSDGKTYNLVWNDEFDGTTLGPDWVPSNTPENGAMKYVNKMDPNDPDGSNIAVRDGMLTLRAFPDTSYGGKFTATSGNIQTREKQSWKFGRFEARIKMPSEQGMWPALWMMPDQNPYGWPKDGEIDWVEYPRTVNPKQDQATLHTASQHSPRGQFDLATTAFYTHTDDLSLDFHDYAVEWDDTGFRFFFDGRKYREINTSAAAQPDLWAQGQGAAGRWDSSWKNEDGSVHQDAPLLAPFDKDFYLILNLGVKGGGGWAAHPAGYVIDPAKSAVIVDHIRVYQTADQMAQQNQKFVKFDPGTASKSTFPQLSRTVGQPFGQLPTPVSTDGSVFGGWYADRWFARPVSATDAVTDDTTLFARWNPPAQSVTVKFDTGGHGATQPDRVVGSGTSIDLPALTEQGWKFEGWFTDAARTQAAPSPYTASADATLYAKWSQIPVGQDTLTDVRLDGTFTGTEYAPVANDRVSGTVALRGGTETVADGRVTTSGAKDGVVATLGANVPLAKWKYATNPFVAETDLTVASVTDQKPDAPATLMSALGNLHMMVGVDGIPYIRLDYQDAANVWKRATVKGTTPIVPGTAYHLSMAYLPTDTATKVRWTINGVEQPVLDSPMPAVGNTTYAGQRVAFGNNANTAFDWPAKVTIDRVRVAATTTAGFTPAEFQLQPVTVTYDAGGHGTTPAPVVVQPGDPVELPALTQDGWRFDGWFTDAARTQPAPKPYLASATTTLYARWTQIVTLTYDLRGHGGTLPPAQVPAGEPAPLPVPTEKGQTFDGWFTDAELKNPVAAPFVPTADTTLYARWHAADAPCTVGKTESRVPTTVSSGGKAYDLVWQDEFCGDQLDRAKWQPGNTPENGAMKYLNQMGDPDNAKNNIYVTGGALNLNANPLSDAQKAQYPGKLASSGLVNTQGIESWKYGRFEARVKTPDQQGFWPALWMMPDQHPYGWPKDGEIDWLETIGADRNINHTSLQTSSFPERTWRQGMWKTNPVEYNHGSPLGDAFHDYAMEWEPGKFTFYFDGRVVGTLTQWEDSWIRDNGTRYEGFPPEPFDKRFYFIANLGVVAPNGWGGAPDATTDWSRNLQLDYVRVYQTAEQRAGEGVHYVKYDNGGYGPTTPARTVPKGTVIDSLPAMQVPGREFEGWFFDKEGHEPARAPVTITDDTTFIARWKPCATSNGFVVEDPICGVWKANPALGAATGPAQELPAGRYQHFAGGSVYSSAAGTYPVWGAIKDAWAAGGWENGRLGYPAGPEVCGLRDGGCYQNFQGGAMIWSPATGAHISVGLIREKWASQGYELGWLGYPTSDEVCGIKDGGCYQNFQGGAILWAPSTGAHFTRGLIREEWASLGYEWGQLGLPTSDEVCGIKNGGCYQNFQGGAILWSPSTGAHANWGAIRGEYAALGYERSPLGLPTSDEVCGLRDGGCYQDFEGGAIIWSPASGAHQSWGAIRDHWARNGYEGGRLGYPVADETCSVQGEWTCTQDFQGGRVTWSPSRGARG